MSFHNLNNIFIFSFLFFLPLFICITNSTPQDDVVSLLGFKSTVTLDPTGVFSTWVSSTDHCNWTGVTCSKRTGHVTSLILSGKNLAGKLNSAVGNLSELRVLSLPSNAFSGDIPPEIGRLRRLQTLELQSNNFSGRIFGEISQISIKFVNLSFNLLTGTIPLGLIGGGKIRVLDLSNNQLSGKINLSNVGDCLFLEHLKLSNNFIVGNVPNEIGKCVNLRTLLLDGNILEGSIPKEIGEISELRVLDLSRNSLTDEIPKDLGKCRKLVVIVLTNLDEFSDDRSLGFFRGEYNAFVGGVPDEVFVIPSLSVFWAPRANIGGRLPENWNVGCSLRVVNLEQNYIEGVIPESIGLCRNLTVLDLSSNIFSADFPSLVQVPCLVFLNVSRNFLSGALPPFVNHSCGQARDLSFLDEEDIRYVYSTISVWMPQMNGRIGSSSRVDPDAIFLAPEVKEFKQFSERSDAYSFGVFLLELVCGREATESYSRESDQNLVEWVQNYHDTNSISTMVDQRLGNRFTIEGMEEYVQLIIRCIDASSELRPSLSYIVTELDRILEREMNLTTGTGEGTPTVTLGSQLFRALK